MSYTLLLHNHIRPCYTYGLMDSETTELLLGAEQRALDANPYPDDTAGQIAWTAAVTTYSTFIKLGADTESLRDDPGLALADFGGVLRCEVCKWRHTLGDISHKLVHGWPKCCGYTMRWWTQRQIDAGEMMTAGDPNG